VKPSSPHVPSRSEFLQVRNRRLHVRHWGEEGAPQLFMLHGWGDVSASFQFVVDELQSRWHVIAPDWRGFGLSQGNRDAYWFPDYLADLDLLLEHYSPARPVNLVAHSLGGNVACLYAGIRPERVARIVNLEGTGLPRHDASEAPKRYAKWLGQLRDEAPSFRSYPDRAAFAERLKKENPRLNDDRAAFLAQHLGQEDATGGIHLAADPGHRWVNPILYRIEEAMVCWRNVTADILWVTGTESFLFKEFFAADSEDYRSRLACFSKLKEVSLPGCGHNMHHEAPQEIARLIEEFVV
jgi:pimeloyl-ACP methyl ester carboxylesterase